MELMKEIVNDKLIVTGKGGEDKNMPWVTLVFNIETDDLVDLEYYSNKDEAKQGHENTIRHFREGANI